MLSFFKKSIFKDSFLNIIASFILTGVVQLLAYPFLAREFPDSVYGMILTIMGVINAVGVILGNSLNNTRLLLQSEYDKNGYNGDFKPILLVTALIGSIIIGITSAKLANEIDVTVLGCIVISLLVLIRAYYSVRFRIIINYKKVLISNVFGVIGYIVGLVITNISGLWFFIFVFGELFSCMYILFFSNIVHDKFKITPIFKETLQKYILIMSGSLFSTLMMYMDRFYIFPFLGAEEVSNYNVASFLGKTVGLIVIPISGVLLTYYTKKSHITLREFSNSTILFSICCFFLFIGIILFGEPITKLLYPTIVNNAKSYIIIANAASMIFILSSTIQPTLLRYCNAKWQPIIQSIYFVTYITLGYFGMNHSGLLGFCYAVLFSNIIQIIMMIVVVAICLYKDNRSR